MQTYTRTVNIDTGKDYDKLDEPEFYRTLGQRAREESGLLDLIRGYFNSMRGEERSTTIHQREGSFEFSLDVTRLTSYQSHRMNVALTTEITHLAHHHPIPVYASLKSITAVFTAVSPNREKKYWQREVDRLAKGLEEEVNNFQKDQEKRRFKPRDMAELVKLQREAFIHYRGSDTSYFNNFDSRFPGGDHRTGEFSQQHFDDRITQGSDLLQSLTYREFYKMVDDSISELGLDTAELRALQKEREEIFSPYRSCWVKHNYERATEEEIEIVSQRLDLVEKKLNDWSLPLFIRLREKGFEYYDLVR